MPILEKEYKAIESARVTLCFEPCSSSSGNAYNNGVRAALKEVAKSLGADFEDNIFSLIDLPAPDSVEAWKILKEKNSKKKK